MRTNSILRNLFLLCATLCAIESGCLFEPHKVRSITIRGHYADDDPSDIYTLTFLYRGQNINEISFDNQSHNADRNAFGGGSFKIVFRYQSDHLAEITYWSSRDLVLRSLYKADEERPERLLLTELTYSLELETDLRVFDIYYDFDSANILFIPILTAVGTRVVTVYRLLPKPIENGFAYYVNFHEPIKILEITTGDSILRELLEWE